MSIDWGNTLPSGDHPISELKHFKTLKRLVDYLEELPQGKEVLLISDTRLAFTNIAVDFLAVTPGEFLEARLPGFLLYTKDEVAKENHDEMDPRIDAGLQALYLGRYHREQQDRIFAAVETRLRRVEGR